ncbi:cation:proton antiporter [Thiocapsa bogorovii]|uniref:cation:proton antiporter n=1 Tax=Thiocapsa bogorovii TaxID=521689 RepID=UPI001E3121DC|nr:cation:proton antiporter [Thiocapsa bogorovii]UHD17637.1 cation:proton antiporter [Thiocapsa bogorovii]
MLQLLSGDHAPANVNTGMSLWLFSSLGIILLLFKVGLKTGARQLRQLGSDAARVAIAGALGTVSLALLVIWLLPVDLSASERFFVAATIGATSIGVVTRMLDDINKSDTPEGRLILGACVLNDVIGLLLLALAIELVVKGHLDLPSIAWLLASSTLFIGAIVLFGDRIGGPLARQLNRIDPAEVRFLAPLAFAFLLGWLGKLPSALAAGRGLDRPTVAVGMLPRGEVALIFVGVGRTLDIIDDQLFAALVAVIILLAFGSALALKWVFPPRSPGVEALLGRLSRRLAR